MVRLPERGEGGPYVLKVTGTNELVFKDVLVGEVWLCSGQSNMEWTVGGAENPDDERKAANHPLIRQIKIPKVPSGFPKEDVDAAWTVCSPETVSDYTAVGYFFGRHLQGELGVPVGLINSSWGGTRIEPWTPPVGFEGEDNLEDIRRKVQMTDPGDAGYQAELGRYLGEMEKWMRGARDSVAVRSPLMPTPAYPAAIQPLSGPGEPTTLYNGMIHPIVPFGIRGAIWYQGESNHTEGMLYFDKKRALLKGWRELWGQGEFPFFYVQIAPYRYGDEAGGVLPVFWEAQNRCLELSNTGQAVIHDIGNLQDIHPRNKQGVGYRLALIALARTYGRTGVEFSGPTFRSLELEGAKARVRFDHVGSGLVSRDGMDLNWFEIAGMNVDFVQAEAVIEGDSVVLSSPEVKQAVAVRFGWDKLAEPNLANREGLPAVPFRAGEVPERDWLSLKVEEAKDYELVYDLNLSKLGAAIGYDVDRTGDFPGGFDRVAYFLELQKSGGNVDYVYVSMDAFTDDVKKVGIPTLASGAVFQVDVTRLNVLSNVRGIQVGEGLDGGNIEFWPHNYGQNNAMSVPNASSGAYDFGDEMAFPPEGYGCMQVHNHEAKQTLFAINQWRSGAGADIGIGNSPGETRDWTFTGNASQYEMKRLRVLVRRK